jgi:serine/threonine-protein kinase
MRIPWKITFRIPARPEFKSRLGKIGAASAWVGGGLILVGVVFVLSFYFAMKVEMRSTQVSVPDLTTLDLDEAGRVSQSMALELEVVGRRHDPAVPSGRILQQEPGPGSSVRRGRKLKLVLSLGGKVLEVPDLAGKADRAVEIELRRDGFAPGDRARAYSARTADGRVMAQVPPADSPAVPNTRVHRLVSNGPYPVRWVMPDLTGYSRTAAERWIRENGFRRGSVRKLRSRGHAPGSVVGQLPLPGYPIRSRGVVDLTVAR